MSRVQELLALLTPVLEAEKSAAAGPWHSDVCSSGPECWCRTIGNVVGSDDLKHCVVPSGAMRTGDAEFIVKLRNALPGLVELLRTWDLPTDDVMQSIVEHATGSERPWKEYGSVSAIWAAIDQRQVDFAVEYQELIKDEKEKGL